MNLIESEKYDVIITDYNMPVMNGKELADRAVELYGIDVKILTVPDGTRIIITFTEKSCL